MKRAKFAPSSPCAIEPRAFGLYFDAAPPLAIERRGGVAIVPVRGPLMHHEDWCFASYDGIKCLVLATLADDAKPSTIVLSLDSPGGMVSGCFDTALEIRAACDAAGVSLYAYVDGQACSAAYALASVAERIAVPPTGIVGSIGCIAELVDVSKMNAAMGVSVRLVTSGARKGDGNPNVPQDDGAVAAVQAQVSQLAEIFFEHVAATRPMQVEEIRALQAGVVIGASAVPTLADDVMSLDEMIEAINGGTFGAEEEIDDMKTKTTAGAGVTGSKAEDDSEYEAAIATLRKAAAGGNEKAKKMLQAELADEPDGDEKKEDGASSEAPAAAAPVPPPSDEKKEDDSKTTSALALETAVRAERNTVLATRPDITPELRASLESLPVENVKAILAATPIKLAPKLGSAAATAVVGGTRPEGAGERPSITPTAERKSMDVIMGIATEHVAPKMDGMKATFPAMTRDERASYLAKREADAKANREADAKAALAG